MSIPKTKVGPEEVQFRQVSLYIFFSENSKQRKDCLGINQFIHSIKKNTCC
jgi:hypothetical protein